MKINKKVLIVLIAIIIVLICGLTIKTFLHENNNPNFILGKNDLGKVYIEGPYGNPNSSNKIAIILGVHPLESKSHNSFYKYLKEYSNSLNNSYYVYMINVSKDKDDFDKSRMNGQLLAQEFVVPDVIKKNYSFILDIHGHREVYSANTFLIAPLNDNKSKTYGNEIIKNVPEMEILNFTPATDGHPTSPDYVSIPILNNGTPSLIFETSIYQSDTEIDKYMSKFILSLDKLLFD